MITPVSDDGQEIVLQEAGVVYFFAALNI